MARKKVVLLPRTEKVLEKVGANIKRARLRRNIRAELLAEQAGISVDTLSAIEKEHQQFRLAHMQPSLRYSNWIMIWRQ